MSKIDFYKGKICVVTGAGSGMGKAVATLLVQNEAIVYALDVQDVTVEGIKEYIQTDLSVKESIDNAFAKLPEHIDCFFGVAGILGANFPFTQVACIDLISNKYMMEEYLTNRMEAGGAIALVSSGTAAGWNKEGNMQYVRPVLETEGWDGAVQALEDLGITAFNAGLAYVYSKFGVNLLVAKMQSLFAAKQIRINAIMPGGTNTNFGKDSQETIDSNTETTYLGYAGRIAEPEEQAYPLLFLNSDMASYVSGALIPVDYGMTIELEAGIQANPIGESLNAIYCMF